MLKAYSVKNGKLSQTKIDGTPSLKWIHLDSAKIGDFEKIKSTNISKRDFKSCLDKQERSRIVSRDKYKLILLKIPSEKTRKTATLGILLTNKSIMTIHGYTCPIILNIINHPENISGTMNNIMLRIIHEVNRSFFEESDKLEQEISKIEEKLYLKSSKRVIKKLFETRQKLIFMVRAASGNRDVINNLNINSALFKFNKVDKLELGELHSDQIQLVETMMIYRDILSNVVEIYNSNLANDMNKIIQRLTVVGSFILLPTLIASIYGMNFKPDTSMYNMPELTWKYGYIFALGLMFFSVVSTYSYFKVKRWV